MVKDVLILEAITVAVAALAMAVTAVVAWRMNRVNVVDATWGLALAALALVDALWSRSWVSWALFAVVGLWAARLSGFMIVRSRGHGEDPRYEAMLGGRLRDVGMGRAIGKVFVVQGLAVCLVSLPLQAAALVPARWTAVVVAGLALALAGLAFEAIGDAQMSAYKRDPDRGPVMDRGLWGWTRHPNYFGDALFWSGIWVAGGLAGGWLAAVLTIASPAAMAWFLAFVTGARLLEKTMMKRPGYPEYAARTSMFVPLPPKRAVPAGRDAS